MYRLKSTTKPAVQPFHRNLSRPDWLVPTLAVFAHVFEIAPGFRGHLRFSYSELSHGDRGIIAPPLCHYLGDGMTAGTDNGFNYIQSKVPLAATEIQLQQLITTAQQDMGKTT